MTPDKIAFSMQLYSTEYMKYYPKKKQNAKVRNQVWTPLLKVIFLKNTDGAFGQYSRSGVRALVDGDVLGKHTDLHGLETDDERRVGLQPKPTRPQSMSRVRFLLGLRVYLAVQLLYVQPYARR